MSLTLEMTNTQYHQKNAGKDPTNATRDFLTDLLTAANYTGEWQVFAIHQVDMNKGPRFKVRTVDQGRRAILIKCKPGDNGTAWEWELIPPARLDPSAVAEDLKRFDGWDGNPRKLAQTTNGVHHSAMPAEKRLTLGEKLAALEADAAAYKAKKAKIAEYRERYETLMRQASEAEEAANRMEAELAEDYAGRNAMDALETLNRLLP